MPPRTIQTNHRFNETKTSCRYCTTFLQSRGLDDISKPWNTVLTETRNFVVVPTLGAIVEGWILLIPKKHYLCVGSLPKESLHELNVLLKSMASLLGAIYGYATVFEHGPSKDGSSLGCGIDHAHLHVVPLEFSLRKTIEEKAPEALAEAKPVTGIKDLSGLYKAGIDYLYLQEPGRQPEVFSAAQVGRQFFRRMVAEQEGKDEQFDYNRFSFHQQVARTVNKITASMMDQS